MFTKNLKYVKPVISFCGKTLKIENSFKHLGITIDSRLTFREQANQVSRKATQLVNKLLSFAKNEFGLNHKALHTIYMGSVLPIISYALSVWAHAIDRQFVIQPLASLQRRVAIRIIKGYRTISIDAANVLAKLTPIDLYLKGRAVIYFAKKPISNRLTEDYLQNTIDLDNIQRPIDCYRLKHYALRQQINQSNNDSTNCKLLITGYKGLDGKDWN